MCRVTNIEKRVLVKWCSLIPREKTYFWTRLLSFGGFPNRITCTVIWENRCLRRPKDGWETAECHKSFQLRRVTGENILTNDCMKMTADWNKNAKMPRGIASTCLLFSSCFCTVGLGCCLIRSTLYWMPCKHLCCHHWPFCVHCRRSVCKTVNLQHCYCN